MVNRWGKDGPHGGRRKYGTTLADSVHSDKPVTRGSTGGVAWVKTLRGIFLSLSRPLL